MQGELSGGKVVVTATEADIPGYGKEREGLELSLEEAAFLLDKRKLTILHGETELSLEALMVRAQDTMPMFTVRYLVYKDLKERGYAVKAGGVDFWLYPRGTRQGEKPAMYFIRILSERDFISLTELDELLISARNMRKGLILAVLDDESDITYYEVKEPGFGGGIELQSTEGKAKASLIGDRVALCDVEFAEKLYNNYFYGKLTKEKRLLLSLVEAAYLMTHNQLDIELANNDYATMEEFVEYASTIEREFFDKYTVYADLRGRGLMLKTGFKFGSHFRGYKAVQQKHSLYLIHVLPRDFVFSMPGLSRAVRLAHGVKKRMIFAFKCNTQASPAEREDEHRIKYVDIGRMKL